MDDREARIVSNENVTANYYLMKLRFDGPVEKPRPGQFVMIKVPDRDVFLRRPFSIYDSGDKTISIMYRVVGKGTLALSHAVRGEKVLVLGPIGNGFNIAKRDACIVVTGGIGVAGVHLLLKHLGKKAVLFYGCADEDETAAIEDLMGFNPHIATLDGSLGFHGNVIAMLEKQIKTFAEQDIEVFTCGPEGMVKGLKKTLAKQKIPCQVLMEERMACGLGLCFGCVVKTTDENEPYKRACKEGPVFDLWQISL